MRGLVGQSVRCVRKGRAECRSDKGNSVALVNVIIPGNAVTKFPLNSFTAQYVIRLAGTVVCSLESKFAVYQAIAFNSIIEFMTNDTRRDISNTRPQ